MRSLKFTFTILFAVVCFFAAHNNANAQIPDIEGYIRVAGTNAPVPNVWVRLTNSDGEEAGNDCVAGAFDQSRYALTDANGKYVFRGWTQMSSQERDDQLGTLIDTNFDGAKDSVWFPNFSSCDPEESHAEFSCGHDPFAVDVVKPIGWTGTFDSVPKTQNGVCMFCINNGVEVSNPPTLFYHVTQTSTPTSITSTPTSRLSPTTSPTRTPTPTTPVGGIPSCSFTSGSGSKSIRVGTADFLSVGITQNGGTVDEVIFTSTNGNVVSVCQSPLCSQGSATYRDSIPTFQSGLTGFTPGQTVRVRVTGRMISEGIICTPTEIEVNVTDTLSWCQFKETDAVTNGGISCSIPPTCTGSSCNNDLIIHDSNESPGVAIADNGTNTGSGDVSSPVPPYGWEADTTYNGIKYNYNYFYRKTQGLAIEQLTFPRINVLSDLTRGNRQEGYYWLRYQGGASLEILQDINIGNNKIVLFVDNADLIIRGRIRVNKGRGMFMVIAKGNIIVASNVGGPQESTPVPDIEGIYFTDKQLRTSTGNANNDNPLHIRGSVVAFDEIVMERSLSNNSQTPAELLEFGPDQLMMFPPRLGDQSYDWKEVAP